MDDDGTMVGVSELMALADGITVALVSGVAAEELAGDGATVAPVSCALRLLEAVAVAEVVAVPAGVLGDTEFEADGDARISIAVEDEDVEEEGDEVGDPAADGSGVAAGVKDSDTDGVALRDAAAAVLLTVGVGL